MLMTRNQREPNAPALPPEALLAKGYIRTTDDAIETLQAALDAEALFGSFSESGEEEAGAGESGETLRVD